MDFVWLYIVFVTNTAWVILEGFCAYAEGMLTPSQMLDEHGERQGLTFITHSGMWSDLVFPPLIVSWILSEYSELWSERQMCFALIFGFCISTLMHRIYMKGDLPDCLAGKGKISMAGWLHFVYMGLVVAVIALFYFFAPAPSLKSLVIVSALLLLHMIIANHIPFVLVNDRFFRSYWLPNLIGKPSPWITLAALTVILSFLVWLRAP